MRTGKINSLPFHLMGLILASIPISSIAELDLKVDVNAFGTFGGSMTNATQVDFYDPITKQLTQITPTIENVGKYPNFEQDIKGGVRFNVGFNEEFLFNVEVYSQGIDQYNVQLDLFYVQWDFAPQWDVRAGRVRLPFFLYSEYYQVGYSYLWTRPPLEVYLMNPFTDFDGITLRNRTALPMGVVATSTLSLGNSNFSFQQAGANFPVSLDRAIIGDFTLGNEHLKFNVAYLAGSIDANYSNVEAGQVRQDLLNPCSFFTQLEPAEIAAIIPNPAEGNSCSMFPLTNFPITQINAVADPATAKLFTSKNVNSQILTFGYQFDWNHIISMAEWTKFRAADNYIADSMGWYATIGFYWDNLTWSVTYSDYKTTDNDDRVVSNTSSSTYINPFSLYGPATPAPIPETFEQSVNEFLALSNVSQSTIDVGVRYDIAKFADIKFDYRYIYPRQGSAGLFDFPPGKRISWVTAVIDVVF